jgi:aflatoxin B1 aldehyde reductase
MNDIDFGFLRSSVANGSAKMSTPAQVGAFINMPKQHKVKEIDTACVYNGGKLEELLGAVGAGIKLGFAVCTKAPGFLSGILYGEKIKKACYASLEALQQDKMDIFYFHGPIEKGRSKSSAKLPTSSTRKGSSRGSA